MDNALTKMTIADCNYGIELACEELYKWKTKKQMFLMYGTKPKQIIFQKVQCG